MTKEILESFLVQPETEYHLREFAREHKIAPGTAKKYLERYVAKGVLAKREERRHMIYSAARDTWQFKLAKRTWNEEQIRTSGLIEFIQHHCGEPEAIILFGSCAYGEDNKHSDIDIAVITHEKNIPDISRFERILGREVQLFLLTGEEIENNPRLANSILNGIVLHGYWEFAA